MSADPAVIALLNQSSATFKTVDLDLCRYLASIAEKLTGGMDLTADEATIAGGYIRAAAAQAAGAPALGQSSEATTPAGSAITLSLTSAQALVLAALLMGSTDPVLVGIAQSLAAAPGVK